MKQEGIIIVIFALALFNNIQMDKAENFLKNIHPEDLRKLDLILFRLVQSYVSLLLM